MSYRPWSLLLLAGLLWNPVARATVVTPLDLPQLVAQADRIVLAHVEAQTARWSSDHSIIYTEVTLRIAQAMKGAVRDGGTLVVRREGGEVDGVGMRVVGAARFEVGEEVVVFVEQRGAAAWTVGMAQGKLHVEVVAGRRFAVRAVNGLAFTSPPMAHRAAQPLDELMATISAQVRARGQR